MIRPQSPCFDAANPSPNPNDPLIGFQFDETYERTEEEVYPGYVNDVEDRITELHEALPDGFKVMAYFRGVADGWGTQTMEDTLEWMECFQSEWDLDGWYLDNADYTGGESGGWYTTYDFIRKVREQVGEEGVLFHHHSLDEWGGHTGLKSIMVDAYVDYTKTGEHGKIADVADVNDLFMRYYMSNYGLSQAFGTYSRGSKDRGYPPIYRTEYLRAAGQNLHCAPNTSGRYPEEGADRTYVYEEYADHFLPVHDTKRAEYAGEFDPDVTWPVPDDGWFRRIGGNDVTVEYVSSTSVRITWTTDAEAVDSWVVYTNVTTEPYDYGWIFWEHPEECDWTTSDCVVGSPNPQEVSDPNGTPRTEHEVEITGLDTNSEYRFRIRSSNGELVPDEIRWGYIGFFDTCPPPDPPILPEDPEPAMEKNRYVSFTPANAGCQTALHVTLVDLPSPFESFEGTQMWVGQPSEVSESAGQSGPTPPPTFWAATLVCDSENAHSTDWSTIDVLHVYSEGIVPNATYEVQAIYEDCDTGDEDNYSAPLSITTSIWGDVTGGCYYPTPCIPPDGAANFVDISAIVDKFNGLSGR